MCWHSGILPRRFGIFFDCVGMAEGIYQVAIENPTVLIVICVVNEYRQNLPGTRYEVVLRKSLKTATSGVIAAVYSRT